jgi:hypothetical protein
VQRTGKSSKDVPMGMQSCNHSEGDEATKSFLKERKVSSEASKVVPKGAQSKSRSSKVVPKGMQSQIPPK